MRIVEIRRPRNRMMKIDCFAFREDSNNGCWCSALDDIYCSREKCSFYKTTEENARLLKSTTKTIKVKKV